MKTGKYFCEACKKYSNILDFSHESLLFTCPKCGSIEFKEMLGLPNYKYATISIVLDNCGTASKAIAYIDETEKLKLIQQHISKFIDYGIFLVIFYTEKDGCKILDKALWEIR